jgi:CheY-like chemotaxis protein
MAQRSILANILIVDDDIAVQAVVRLLLEREGHHVVGASDGLEGLRVFAIGNFDLLIVDIFMPGMNGLETVSHVQQQRPDIPVIVISGRPISSDFGVGPGFLTTATKPGLISSLRKPFKASALRTIVAECLEVAASKSSVGAKGAGGDALHP